MYRYALSKRQRSPLNTLTATVHERRVVYADRAEAASSCAKKSLLYYVEEPGEEELAVAPYEAFADGTDARRRRSRRL